MLKKKIEDICNRQVEREGYSSNLYLAMASWAEINGFSGVAAWMYTVRLMKKEFICLSLLNILMKEEVKLLCRL